MSFLVRQIPGLGLGRPMRHLGLIAAGRLTSRSDYISRVLAGRGVSMDAYMVGHFPTAKQRGAAAVDPSSSMFPKELRGALGSR